MSKHTPPTEYSQDFLDGMLNRMAVMHPSHEQAHFRATDSSESPGRRWHDNGSKLRGNAG